jgi:hypothetical protein
MQKYAPKQESLGIKNVGGGAVSILLLTCDHFVVIFKNTTHFLLLPSSFPLLSDFRLPTSTALSPFTFYLVPFSFLLNVLSRFLLSKNTRQNKKAWELKMWEGAQSRFCY